MIRRNPALFGVPFIALIVGGSFGLQHLTQIRYDVHDRRTKKVTTKEEQLLESKKKRKFDIREEYFRLQAQEDNSDWEPKRIERPKDVPEWGVAPEAPRQLPEGGFTERDAKRRQSAKARRENTPSDSSKP